MSKSPHQTVKIPNLEQYVAIFPKGQVLDPFPKGSEKSLLEAQLLNLSVGHMLYSSFKQ